MVEDSGAMGMGCVATAESACVALEEDKSIEIVAANLAVAALLDEAGLTPKPALVDERGRGAHHDLDLDMMRRSAKGLWASFAKIAGCAKGRQVDPELRLALGKLGREAEEVMLSLTGGINTHRGAIWSLGLLVAGAAVCGSLSPEDITCTAGIIARIPDGLFEMRMGNGVDVQRQYGVEGARYEAASGFPHVIKIGLPMLRRSRARNIPEQNAQLDTLLAIMASLDDTCLLHRGGWEALKAAQSGAGAVLAAGGSSNPEGWRELEALDRTLISHWASPGGSADLLAATLFVDRYSRLQVPARIDGVGSGYGIN